MAQNRNAGAVFELFAETYGVKYRNAVRKMAKYRDEVMAFCAFPAKHWKHGRVTNPIGRAFLTARNRARKTRGCLSRKTAIVMMLGLMMSA